MKCRKQKRRRICLVILAVMMLLVGCSKQKQEQISYTDTAMGTIVQQTIYIQPQKGTSENVVENVMDLLDSLEKNVLSWREETSEVYGINVSSSKEGCVLSADMQEYLEVLRDVWDKSKGAFDITVGEVSRLWDIDTWTLKDSEEFLMPSENQIQQALKNTGFDKIMIADGRISMPEGMQLDLGAVGKGIACDEIRDFLEERKLVTGAVISVGGSVLTYGEKPDGSHWKVGIRHPRNSQEYLAVLQLPGGWCVSTSGDYERYVEKDGIRYHHIMDPKTGAPADSDVISVTVISESGCLSDALSTACFVLGKEKGMALAKVYGAEILMVDKDLQVSMSEGMDKLLVLE